MKHQHFVHIARKRGMVRWFPSNRVERLRQRRSDGFIFAGSYSLSQGRFIEHPLLNLSYEEYDCVEIKPDELVAVGDIVRE